MITTIDLPAGHVLRVQDHTVELIVNGIPVAGFVVEEGDLDDPTFVIWNEQGDASFIINLGKLDLRMSPADIEVQVRRAPFDTF